MSYNDERAHGGAVVFDLEAVALADAGDYLEPASAPSNYKDEAKIAAYCEQARREQIEKAALDIDLARIVALGWQAEDDDAPTVKAAETVDDEHDLLTAFWRQVRTSDARPTLIGFNCLGYDLPVLLRRSLYLGVVSPRLPINKYRHDGIVDLMLLLSFDGALKYRGLDFYVRRFGLDVPENAHSGADIGGLVAAGDYASVAEHCRCDVLRTAALARRIGVLHPLTEPAIV